MRGDTAPDGTELEGSEHARVVAVVAKRGERPGVNVTVERPASRTTCRPNGVNRRDPLREGWAIERRLRDRPETPRLSTANMTMSPRCGQARSESRTEVEGRFT